MRPLSIGKFFTIMCLTICTSEAAKNHRREKSLKESRELGKSESRSGSKFPAKKVERAILDSERPSQGAPFYPGNPGGHKYPEEAAECKNCVWSVQPGRIGEGARLRLDFSHPSSNCSCSNFRGSAEVLAGPWRLPPEAPVVLGRDWSPQTTLRDVVTTTKVTKKPGGFFKGIQDFFKHSLHMDKTTASLKLTTTTPAPGATSSSGVAKGDNFQPQPPSVLLNRPHEDLAAKSDKAAPSLPETKQLSRGREATFNLRIKAVALPRKTGTHMVFRSLKRKPQRATLSSGNEKTGNEEAS